MSRLADIRATSRWSDIAEGQPQHAGIAVFLTLGALHLLGDPAEAPRFLGLDAHGWARLSMILALAHQGIVALVFRLQLHRAVLTRVFGRHDMTVWAALFLPLLLARPATVFVAGWLDTTPLTGFRWAEVAAGAALIGVAAWVVRAVLMDFTLPRALGGDHFRDEIAAMPLVRDGPFGVVPNAMYGLAFLGLWGIALMFGSWNALVAAAFQHAYIWVHMHCTEAPDMRWIYGGRAA
ncbi:MAG: methyltransferase [Rhodobacter sp.]|nr:methyltransferase [Rhodobacter sp.]